MKKTIAAAIAIALAFATPAFADENDDWAKAHYSQICLDAGYLWEGIITGKQSGASKSAMELMANNLDTLLNQMAALSIIEQVYSDPSYDKIHPGMMKITMRANCQKMMDADANKTKN